MERRAFALFLASVLIISVVTGISQATALEFPGWIANLAKWYEQNLITKGEFINAIKFLADKKIVDLESRELRALLPSELAGLTSVKYEIMVTNGLKHIIPLDKIKSGGPPPDGIPSIDDPKFEQAAGAVFMSDDDLVVGLRLNGVTKAYPLFIMTWHEIVNDKFGDTPVAVTYCPLCFTNQVFERTINGKVVEFGTSGKLYNSNLVMYDRLTGSYWSQALGLAITGELSGYELQRIPFDIMKWVDWKSIYPDTLVLTTETGHLRPYSSDPYADYFKDPRILFPVDNKDDRLPPKEIVLGFESKDTFKAYRLQDVQFNKVLNDKVGDKEILIVSTVPYMARAFDRNLDGQVLDFQFSDNKILDKQTRSEWSIEGVAIFGQLEGRQLERIPYDPGFWFEWVAFHPSTEIYSNFD